MERTCRNGRGERQMPAHRIKCVCRNRLTPPFNSRNWPHNSLSAPWSPTPSLHRSVSLANPGVNFRLCESRASADMRCVVAVHGAGREDAHSGRARHKRQRLRGGCWQGQILHRRAGLLPASGRHLLCVCAMHLCGDEIPGERLADPRGAQQQAAVYRRRGTVAVVRIARMLPALYAWPFPSRGEVTLTYGDAKVANCDTKVWHGATEKCP
jgi:hypothetical protein